MRQGRTIARVLVGAVDGRLPAVGRQLRRVRRGYGRLTKQQARWRARQEPRNRSITTWVGQGRIAAYAGDGGRREDALLFHPSGVAFDNRGNLYIADSNNHAIRKVLLDGTVTTVAGGNGMGYAGDGGPAREAMLFLPTDIALDQRGDVFVADRDNHAIRRIDASGVITTVAGGNGRGYTGDGGPAGAAQLNHPRGIALDCTGSIFFTDRHNNAVRRVDPSGIITTVAGGNGQGYRGDGRPARQARLNHPRGVALGWDNNLYVTDYLNHRIRRVDSNGIIATVAGGNGPGSKGDFGPARWAQLNKPSGLAFGRDGMYVTEHANHSVRRVDRAGFITTTAGGHGAGFGGDGGRAAPGRLHWPSGIAVGADGCIYIADRNNDVVRRLA
jgi:sugar lactone lactonase YvrE